ncbi:MAG: TlpA disulfide reductase family protein [Gemmatimonadota bacterium]
MAAFVSFAMAIGATAVSAQDIGLAIGAKPAAAIVEDLDGKPVDLAQFVGKKPVLVEFWATWCPLCKELEPALNAARKKYGDALEVLIVAVGVNQTPRSIKRHVEGHPMPGRVLWDGKGAAVRAFEAPSTSYVVVLDAAGKVVYTGSGSEQRFESALAKVFPGAK